jgi:hypothetical protein
VLREQREGLWWGREGFVLELDELEFPGDKEEFQKEKETEYTKMQQNKNT